jgi:hypothetical protein
LYLCPLTAAQCCFSPPANYPLGTSLIAIAVGDFNGDGKPDLAVANPALDSNGEINASDPGSISILTGNGDGTFGPATGLDAGKIHGPLPSVILITTATKTWQYWMRASRA